MDVTVYNHGYHGDLNETNLVGSVDKKGKKLVKSTYNTLMKVIEICKPGTKFNQIGDVIHDFVEKDNFSVVRDITGHGICKLFHTAPTILHYRKNKSPGKDGKYFYNRINDK